MKEKEEEEEEDEMKRVKEVYLIRMGKYITKIRYFFYSLGNY